MGELTLQFEWTTHAMTATSGLSASVVWEFIARNWAFVGIATTLLLLVVVPLSFTLKYANVAVNLMDNFAPPMIPGNIERGSREGDSLRFSAFDGHVLYGTIWRSLTEGDPKGVIIFGHEYGMDRWSSCAYARTLREHGYDVFAFDFRGHGESPPEDGYKPRQFPSDREQSDMVGAIGYVGNWLERQGRSREVGLFGLSRGGGAAILASVGIDSVKAIAVDGAFSSDSVMEYMLQRWARVFAKLRVAYENHPPIYWRFLRWVIIRKAEGKFRCRYPSVRKALSRIGTMPLFIIHGERDSYIALEQAQLLYDVASEPKSLWVVPRARHNQSIYQQPEAYARRLSGFFDVHLAGLEMAEMAEGADETQDICPEASIRR